MQVERLAHVHEAVKIPAPDATRMDCEHPLSWDAMLAASTIPAPPYAPVGFAVQGLILPVAAAVAAAVEGLQAAREELDEETERIARGDDVWNVEARTDRIFAVLRRVVALASADEAGLPLSVWSRDAAYEVHAKFATRHARAVIANAQTQ